VYILIKNINLLKKINKLIFCFLKKFINLFFNNFFFI
jgi:hypothetical protein